MGIRLFTDSELFIQKQAATGRLVRPTLIVLAVAFALTAQAAAVYYSLGSDIDQIINAVILLGGYYFLEAFALWLVFSFMLYLLTIGVGGHPLMGHIVRVVAWGMVPFIAAGLVWALGKYYALRDVAAPSPSVNSRIEHETGAMAEYTAEAAGEPVLVGAMVLGSVFLVASGYFWTVGMVKAGDMSRRRAAVVSAIPLVLYVGWKLLGVV